MAPCRRRWPVRGVVASELLARDLAAARRIVSRAVQRNARCLGARYYLVTTEAVAQRGGY